MDFFVKVLNDYEFVNLVKCFLYDVYIYEMGWEFCEDSLISFCIDKDKRNEFIFCDVFDDVVVWFGVYKDDKFIGVICVV